MVKSSEGIRKKINEKVLEASGKVEEEEPRGNLTCMPKTKSAV